MPKTLQKLFFTILLSSILTFFILFCLKPIFTTNTLLFHYSLTPFDICQKYPKEWQLIKQLYIFFCFFTNLLFSYRLCSLFFPASSPTSSLPKEKKLQNLSCLQLLVGRDTLSNQKIYLTEKSLYQNILITGTIGSGKTSSAMYPFTRQLIFHHHQNEKEKLGMLILDVKGNYHQYVTQVAKACHREQDLVIISLLGNEKYNPLHKPNLKPAVLANRLKTILELFSENNSESYWLDKVEQVLMECIKYCRLYNNGYVTFPELHQLVTIPTYYLSKIPNLRTLFQNGKMSNHEVYDLTSSLDFFEKEFFSLDIRTLSIIQSEITRITNVFISDYDILSTFSPPLSSLTFYGFDELIQKGKIVVLSMNIAEYRNLSKIIATYLKLDFQSEVLLTLSKNIHHRPTCFISDEFHEYITNSDAAFFAQSREAKCINIVATQSYTSFLHTLRNEASAKVIIQNLINKFWFRTDDLFTVESAQKQIGKEEKEKTATNISENAKETTFNYLMNAFHAQNSNLSESINTYFQTDFIYDTNHLTKSLETFHCLCFLSDGSKIFYSSFLKMLPYFKNNSN